MQVCRLDAEQVGSRAVVRAAVRAVLRAVVGRAAVRAVRERLGRPPLAFPVVTDALGLCSESVRCREYVGLVCGAVPGDCGGVQRVAF